MDTKVLLGNSWFKDVKQNEIVVFLENKDIFNMLFQCLWDTSKIVVGGDFKEGNRKWIKYLSINQEKEQQNKEQEIEIKADGGQSTK